MSRTKSRRLILPIAFLILTIASQAWIFSNSLMDGTQSSEQSGRVVEIVRPAYQEVLPAVNIEPTEENIHHYVRKTAHFIEFFALGALFSADALAWDLKVRAATPLSFAAGAVCAALDELHQTFVPGRAGMWQDVLLDCAGVAAGVAAVFAAALIIKRIKNDRRAR